MGEATSKGGRRGLRVACAWLLAWQCTACHDARGEGAAGDAAPAPSDLSVEALMDPNTCAGCHPQHFREWASSMHAYASRDPIFVAMNARGQDETDGELGTFCADCHAPMAVREGLTIDGTDLDELERAYQGVTCYFCHTVDAVAQEHDNPLRLPANNPLSSARDTVMRGGLADPVRPSVHGVAYSRLHDSALPESSDLCGPCHDIVTDNGVHLERTYAEWQGSRQAGSTSCAGCHMDSYAGAVATMGADALPPPSQTRAPHRHLMPGIDTALTEFPDRDVQLAAIDCALRNAVGIALRVEPDGKVIVKLDNALAHGFPSGATQDRRAWVSIQAYDGEGNQIYSEGVLAEDEPVPSTTARRSPAQLRDWLLDAEGREVHMFWQAAPSDDHPGYRTGTLAPEPPWRAAQPNADQRPVDNGHSRTIRRLVSLTAERVRVAIHIRAIDHDLVDDLVQSGHLDEADGRAIQAEIVTHTMSTSVLEWQRERDGPNWVTRPLDTDLRCPDAWQDLLD